MYCVHDIKYLYFDIEINCSKLYSIFHTPTSETGLKSAIAGHHCYNLI